jgi:hypothetical protein
MKELSIAPEAAETLAEDADDAKTAQFYREVAERGETVSTQITDKKGEELVKQIVLSAMIQQIKDNLNEMTADMTRYDAGRVRGAIEALELVHRHGELPNISEEEMMQPFPEVLNDE